MTTTARPRRGGCCTGVVAGLLLVVAGLAGLAVLLVALGALVPGVGGLLPVSAGCPGTRRSPSPATGPTFVVAGLVAVVLAVLLRRRLGRAGTVVAVGAGVATAALAVVVAIVVATTISAGGSVNPLTAVAPTRGSPCPTATPSTRRAPTASRCTPRCGIRAEPRAPPPFWSTSTAAAGSGARSSATPTDLRAFADRGRLVISVAYTLATPTRPTWDVAGPQVACALTKVAALAPGLGGDPDRIVLAGDSAGGQLAVSVAYHAASGTQASSCGGVVPVPRGVVVQYPAVDLGGRLRARHDPRPARRCPTAYLLDATRGHAPAGARPLPSALRGPGDHARRPRPRSSSARPATSWSRPGASPRSPTGAGGRGRRDAGPGAVRQPRLRHLGAGSLGNQASLSIREHWLTGTAGDGPASGPQRRISTSRTHAPTSPPNSANPIGGREPDQPAEPADEQRRSRRGACPRRARPAAAAS